MFKDRHLPGGEPLRLGQGIALASQPLEFLKLTHTHAHTQRVLYESARNLSRLYHPARSYPDRGSVMLLRTIKLLPPTGLVAGTAVREGTFEVKAHQAIGDGRGATPQIPLHLLLLPMEFALLLLGSLERPVSRRDAGRVMSIQGHHSGRGDGSSHRFSTTFSSDTIWGSCMWRTV